MYLMSAENELDDLEKLVEEKQRELEMAKEANSTEVERLKKELYAITIYINYKY